MKKIFTLIIICMTGVLSGCLGNTTSKDAEIQMPQANKQAETVQQIYALGDSLTAGYQLPLDDAYPAQLEYLLKQSGYANKIINAGKSGDTSAGLLARIEWLTEESQADDIAILVIGANDGLQSLPLDQLESNIRNIIIYLQEKQIKVILGGMQLPTNLDPVYRESFSSIYPKIAQEFDLPLIDFFLEGVAAERTLNLPDGIHPNKAGYAVIAENTKIFLEKQSLLK